MPVHRFSISSQGVRKGLYQSNIITVKFFLLDDLKGKDPQRFSANAFEYFGKFIEISLVKIKFRFSKKATKFKTISDLI